MLSKLCCKKMPGDETSCTVLARVHVCLESKHRRIRCRNQRCGVMPSNLGRRSLRWVVAYCLPDVLISPLLLLQKADRLVISRFLYHHTLNRPILRRYSLMTSKPKSIRMSMPPFSAWRTHLRAISTQTACTTERWENVIRGSLVIPINRPQRLAGSSVVFRGTGSVVQMVFEHGLQTEKV